MKKLTIGISALALACTGAVFAAEMPKAAGPDHELTRAEAKDHAEKLFDRLDVNHDGKLDEADRTARINEMFDRIDTNHDGSISREEFAAAHKHMGMMGPGPMDRGPMGREGMGAPGHDGPPPPPPGGPEGKRGNGPRMGHDGREGMRGPGEHPGGHMGDMMVLMHMADPNHTGTITKDAFVNAALQLFDKADTNHDGKLSREERKAARDRMHAAMERRMGQPGMGQPGMGQPGMGKGPDAGQDDMPPPPSGN